MLIFHSFVYVYQRVDMSFFMGGWLRGCILYTGYFCETCCFLILVHKRINYIILIFFATWRDMRVMTLR